MRRHGRDAVAEAEFASDLRRALKQVYFALSGDALDASAETFARTGMVGVFNRYRAATIVDGAGHWVHQEAPDEVDAAPDTFLDSL
jgi:pimeloyl-ACP methyl ester carboxylesterase